MQIHTKGLLMLFLCLFVTGGCLPASLNLKERPPEPLLSEAPVPKLFPLTTQEKIQAVHHWDLIAGHTAGLVKKGLETSYAARRLRGIYVSPSGVTPFEKVFHDLLITHLFEQGLSVSKDPEDNVILSFDIELVRHPKRILGIDSRLYASLGPGLVVKTGPPVPEDRNHVGRDYRISNKTRLSHEVGDHVFALPENEVVLTTSLTQNGSYMMRNSSIYYIDDTEWWQYVQQADITSPPQSNYTLTDR